MEPVQLAIDAVRRREPATHLLDQIPRENVRPALVQIFAVASADELQPDVLEWVRQQHAGETTIIMMALARMNLRVLDWLLTKKPDIFSWEYCAFWVVLSRKTTAFNDFYLWFAARVDVQDLALHSIKNASHYFSHHSVSFLLSLGSHPALERAMLCAVIERRFWGYLSLFASRPQLVREICTENGGLLLRRLGSRKKKWRNGFAGLRKFVQRFLTRSDYASVGLAPPGAVLY
jgi:hypothetical protein